MQKIKMYAKSKTPSDCKVVGMCASEEGTIILDGPEDSDIRSILKKLQILNPKSACKVGSSFVVFNKKNTVAYIVVGMGNSGKVMNAKDYGAVVGAANKAMEKVGVKRVEWCITTCVVEGHELVWPIFFTAQKIQESAIPMETLKTKALKDTESMQKKCVHFLHGNGHLDESKALSRGVALGKGIILTKKLGDLPPNICTPEYLAHTAEGMKSKSLAIKIFKEPEIKKMKMGAFLAISKGSIVPPRFIILTYNGGEKGEAPVVLVGKGVTFDAGGISIKPSANMDKMKYDMSGAGTVLGVMQTIAEMGLPLNVVGVIPSCENLPSSKAVKPGDVVTSMSGHTIEVVDTDAEGRMLLCDALTYATQLKPKVIIDMATLTGACVVALGDVMSGLYSNDANLARDLLQAGTYALDPTWEMPMGGAYQKDMDSDVADMKNYGGRKAGSVTAACFLSRFVKGHKWAHLDIAGIANTDECATGRPVSMIVQYLMNASQAGCADSLL